MTLWRHRLATEFDALKTKRREEKRVLIPTPSAAAPITTTLPAANAAAFDCRSSLLTRLFCQIDFLL